MEKTYTMCQSCGFPLKKDKKGGGTEKDGSLSKKYYSMCYMNGEFLNPPEIDTAEKMQKFCIQDNEESWDEWDLCLACHPPNSKIREVAKKLN